MSSFEQLRHQCCETNLLLRQSGLVDLTFGNASVADPQQGVFAIKPSGVPYPELTAEKMVVIDYNGKVVEGDLRPSSDTDTHRCILAANPAICSVVHTHSRHAVAFAQANRPIPCLGTTHADHFNGEVPVTRALRSYEIEHDYELNTGRAITELFATHCPIQTPAALVRSHGPFTWGPGGEKAVENAIALEIVAQMAIHTLALNPSIERIDSVLLKKHNSRKHGPNA